jgi:putative intracellular protease/amidase
MVATRRLLIIVTNAGEFQKVGYRTGLWLGELTHFVDVVEQAGFATDIASPAGGYVPIDPESLILQELGHALGVDGKVHKRYADRKFMNRLVDTKKVGDCDHQAYDAIYLTGGHGVLFDFPNSTELASLVAKFYDAGQIVSAVCHGPSGLLNVTLADGRNILEGQACTGFSWREEVLARRDDAVPFNLEEEMQKRSGRYEKAAVPFARNVVVAGKLITGQNPASARAVGETVVKALLEMAKKAGPELRSVG